MPALRNPKHERFAQEVAKGKTLEEAHGLAGFKADRRNASHLRQRDDIGRRVDELLTTHIHIERKATERAIERTAITKERVAQELALLGFANMLDYVTVGSNGDAFVDLSKMTRDQAAAIQEVTVDSYVDGRGEDARDVKRVKFKLGDKRQALMDIAKLFGWLIDRKESRDVDEFADMGPDALKSYIIQELRGDEAGDDADATRH